MLGILAEEQNKGSNDWFTLITWFMLKNYWNMFLMYNDKRSLQIYLLANEEPLKGRWACDHVTSDLSLSAEGQGECLRRVLKLRILLVIYMIQHPHRPKCGTDLHWPGPQCKHKECDAWAPKTVCFCSLHWEKMHMRETWRLFKPNETCRLDYIGNVRIVILFLNNLFGLQDLLITSLQTRPLCGSVTLGRDKRISPAQLFQ